MNSFRLSMLPLTFAIASTAFAQEGQMSEPHVGYIYPAGGRRGTTFEATVGGRYLYAGGVHVSGSGVKATITDQERQVTPTEQSQLSENLSKIQEKRKQGQRVTPEEAKMAEEIRRKLNPDISSSGQKISEVRGTSRYGRRCSNNNHEGLR